jgi:hypothetical protein
MMPIAELPGRIGNFIGGVADKAKSTFGFEESGLNKEEELYGMNPRRAYWAAALGDLANVAGGGKFEGRGQQVNAQQQQWQEQLRQQKELEEMKQQQLHINYLNAVKAKNETDPSIIREARLLYPDDPARQQKYVEDYRAKRDPIQINIGDKWQDKLMGNIMETRGEAMKADASNRRYQGMLELIPHLGRTGPGAEAITRFKGAATQFGAEEWVNFLDGVAETAGLDLTSGNQGARELFIALQNQDIVNRARELYPVSNSDLKILKQMTATLSGQSDPKAMEAIIREQIELNRGTIDYYEWMRNSLPPEIGPPPSVRGGSMDVRGVLPSSPQGAVVRPPPSPPGTSSPGAKPIQQMTPEEIKAELDVLRRELGN